MQRLHYLDNLKVCLTVLLMIVLQNVVDSKN